MLKRAMAMANKNLTATLADDGQSKPHVLNEASASTRSIILEPPVKALRIHDEAHTTVKIDDVTIVAHLAASKSKARTLTARRRLYSYSRLVIDPRKSSKIVFWDAITLFALAFTASVTPCAPPAARAARPSAPPAAPASNSWRRRDSPVPVCPCPLWHNAHRDAPASCHGARIPLRL